MLSPNRKVKPDPLGLSHQLTRQLAIYECRPAPASTALTLNNANELAVELTQLDGQTRYVCKADGGYTVITEHGVNFRKAEP